MKPKGLVLSGQPARSDFRDRRPGGGGPSKTANNMISTDKNLVPSMVARLQQQQHQNQPGSANSNSNNNTNSSPEPEWPPRNPESLKEQASGEMKAFDQDGLILPRRVPHQAMGQSVGQSTVIRDLNRELKFNQVRGKNVLDQKSELAKAMQKLEATRRKREAEQERLTRRTSLELRLEERAERIARECEQQLKGSGESLDTSNEATSGDTACLDVASSTAGAKPATVANEGNSVANCTMSTSGRQLPNVTIKTFQTR